MPTAFSVAYPRQEATGRKSTARAKVWGVVILQSSSNGASTSSASMVVVRVVVEKKESKDFAASS